MKLTPHFGKLLLPHDLLIPSLVVGLGLDVVVGKGKEKGRERSWYPELLKGFPGRCLRTGAGQSHSQKPSGLGSHSSRVGAQPSGIRMTTALDPDIGTHLYVNKDPLCPRVHSLSWAHHREVAAVDPVAQEDARAGYAGQLSEEQWPEFGAASHSAKLDRGLPSGQSG
jgi:hypothetical protein